MRITTPAAVIAALLAGLASDGHAADAAARTVPLTTDRPTVTVDLPSTWTVTAYPSNTLAAQRRIAVGAATLVFTAQPAGTRRVPLRPFQLDPAMTAEADPTRMTWTPFPERMGVLSCEQHTFPDSEISNGAESELMLRCRLNADTDLFIYGIDSIAPSTQDSAYPALQAEGRAILTSFRRVDPAPAAGMGPDGKAR